MTDPEGLAAVLAAIDAVNARDPNRIEVRGESRPKELVHAELASEWIAALCRDPSDELRIAARAHHIRRWEIPRARYPEGRAGYHRWRRELQAFHAEAAGEILRAAGYGDAAISRVQAIIRKEGLGRDPEVQAFEDALCLVFLETQLCELAARLDEVKLIEVIRKTLAKMSPAAISRARGLPLVPAHVDLIERAAAR